jgi:bla regulator protein blaR1
MASQPMVLLINLTCATTIAVLLVCLSRRALRRAAGAQAAYWLWLMIPASALAVMLPASSHTLGALSWVMPHSVSRALSILTAGQASMTYEVIGVLVWAVGAVAMMIVTVRRQQTFVRSLRPLWGLPNDTYRSSAVVEPMLVGAWQPRIVLPADFEARYTQEECALVLAHERAHVQRSDALANAIATGWLCLFWFNPLVYWALGRFRFDQELACDAQVLATTGSVRRSYADALLKVQLSVEQVEAVPIGCHWRAGHPLAERIVMLKSPLPGVLRRVVGVAAVLTLIVSGSYVSWVTQPISHPHFLGVSFGSHTSC